MPDPEEFDRLLETALSTYATPAPEFEKRVLRSISSAGPAPAVRRRWTLWAVALPAAVCLLMAIILARHSRQPHAPEAQLAQTAPAVPREMHHERAQAGRATVAHNHALKLSAASASPALAAALPKRDEFPTPQPLTPSEQAFLRCVSAAPEKDRRALIEAQAQQGAPLEISAIRIKPFTVPGQTGNQGEP